MNHNNLIKTNTTVQEKETKRTIRCGLLKTIVHIYLDTDYFFLCKIHDNTQSNS